MFSHLKVNKILWSITTGLTFFAAIFGIVSPQMYNGLFAKEFIPGAFPQDILTAVLTLYLFSLILRTKDDAIQEHIFIFGIVGSFFYLYGIFTIERVYNYLYLLYCGIFALSFWSMIYSLMHINYITINKIVYSKISVRIISVFGLIIATLFTFLWISALLPLMKNHVRIEYLYSIYLLDLCFIMPAFFITSLLSLRGNMIGIVFLPAIFIIGFFVIFPLGLGEIAKPFYGQKMNVPSMIMSFVFSICMAMAGLYHLKYIKVKSTPPM